MIVLEGIGKSYDLGTVKVSALDMVSISIDQGEYVSVMGPSGSGKSTFLNILGILERPTEGRYMLEGYDITRLPDREQARIRNQHFGFVFQSFNLFSELSAMENVMLPMSYAGVHYGERRQRAGELLERLGLADRLHHLPTMMSGGEQQRVAIARALVHQPLVVLADEPTASLDTERGLQVVETFRDLVREQGRAGVMVTHDLRMVRYTDAVVQMVDGKVSGILRDPLAIENLSGLHGRLTGIAAPLASPLRPLAPPPAVAA
jgi:putative ABC transport system ATP-binding protein